MMKFSTIAGGAWIRAGWRRLLPLLAAAALLSGCASTPEKRIRQNPELFDSFPAEVQENLRSGRVEIGYTPEMVYFALGAPDRRVTRRTADEEREVWHYQGRYLTTDTIQVHDPYGRFTRIEPVIYIDRTTEHRYTRARLEFVEDKLVEIQQVER